MRGGGRASSTCPAVMAAQARRFIRTETEAHHSTGLAGCGQHVGMDGGPLAAASCGGRQKVGGGRKRKEEGRKRKEGRKERGGRRKVEGGRGKKEGRKERERRKEEGGRGKRRGQDGRERGKAGRKEEGRGRRWKAEEGQSFRSEKRPPWPRNQACPQPHCLPARCFGPGGKAQSPLAR